MRTSNYQQFGFFKSNRPINDAKVNRFMSVFKDIGYIEALPILTDNQYRIIDGQHRFVACKKMNMPIIYTIVKEGDPEKLMIEINKNQDIWRLQQYIHHYAELGVKYHKMVREFEEKYKLGISNAILICTKNKEHNRGHSLRTGKDLPLNDKRDAIALYVKSMSGLPFYKSTHFVNAVVSLFKKAKKADLEKLHKRHLAIQQQATTGMYLNVFANIINKNRPEDSKIQL